MMRIAVIMDPFEGIHPDKDTSYILIKAALERGHQVFHVAQENLTLQGQELWAHVHEMRLGATTTDLLTKSTQEILVSMESMDLVLIRTDPPFDRRYFYTTLLLDFLPPTTRVVNSTQGLRDWNEKLSALHFKQWLPPSLISQREDELLQFIDTYGDVIIKPLDGFGGRGIRRVNKNDTQLKKWLAEMTHQGSQKIVANKYLPEAESGDKRIMLVDGEPFSCLIRIAARPGDLNNLDQGGTAYPYELTEEDRAICKVLGPEFKRRGLFLVGIDLLGYYLTEINITSPTGLQQMMRFTGRPLHHEIIAKLELPTKK